MIKIALVKGDAKCMYHAQLLSKLEPTKTARHASSNQECRTCRASSRLQPGPNIGHVLFGAAVSRAANVSQALSVELSSTWTGDSRASNIYIRVMRCHNLCSPVCANVTLGTPTCGALLLRRPQQQQSRQQSHRTNFKNALHDASAARRAEHSASHLALCACCSSNNFVPCSIPTPSLLL
jgi:hypothetical protein